MNTPIYKRCPKKLKEAKITETQLLVSYRAPYRPSATRVREMQKAIQKAIIDLGWFGEKSSICAEVLEIDWLQFCPKCGVKMVDKIELGTERSTRPAVVWKCERCGKTKRRELRPK